MKKKNNDKIPKGWIVNAHAIYSNVVRMCREHFGLSADELNAEWLYICDTERNLRRLAIRLNELIATADSIYPVTFPEYEERRLCQTKAMGICNTIKLQVQLFLIEKNFNINRYYNLIKYCDKEYNCIKEWRKSDNRLLPKIKGSSLYASASNFANLNNNGNANNNVASNTNIAPAPITPPFIPSDTSGEQTKADDKETASCLRQYRMTEQMPSPDDTV